MFMPLSMTGQVFPQVIEGRKGAGAPVSGEALTPGSGAVDSPMPSIRVADLSVNAVRVMPPASIGRVVLRKRPPTSEQEQMAPV